MPTPTAVSDATSPSCLAGARGSRRRAASDSTAASSSAPWVRAASAASSSMRRPSAHTRGMSMPAATLMAALWRQVRQRSSKASMRKL